MNLLFLLGDDRYLHVWCYPVVSEKKGINAIQGTGDTPTTKTI